MNLHVSTATKSPWHSGETTIQKSVGVAEKMDDIGRRFVRDHLIEQHRLFYPQLPFILAGTVDQTGDPWATIIAGHPGFMQAVDERSLHISASRDPSDPADAGMEDRDVIGLLGIELQTRRRNRLNGVINRSGQSEFSLTVEHSYGNCPRYIQLRDFSVVRDPNTPFGGEIRKSTGLDKEARDLVASSDTFFVASYSDEAGQRQVDVSHRGGKPGFVRVGADDILTIPDFAGNLFFNTLGNILLNGRAGLLFVDFASGDVLQLTGTADVVLDSPEIEAFQGAERIWHFRTKQLVRRRGALPLRWSMHENGESIYSTMTGDWQQATERVKARERAQEWRPFRVERIVEESASIRSITLTPVDGTGLIQHRAGQHLPIRVLLPGQDAPTIRTYTLSVAPSDNAYRISVKLEGQVSQHLHRMSVGDILEARAPAGEFTVDALQPRPAVLLAAGVGITPILAMLRHIVYEGLRKQHVRKTWIFSSAHTKADRAFDDEITTLARAAGGAVKIVRVLSHVEDAVKDIDFDEAGRITTDLLKRSLPLDDYEFYLCGPSAFMQDTYSGLRSLNIADSRIHAESFGPAVIRRIPDDPQSTSNRPHPATKSVPVIFVDSSKEARWTPESGSLLDLAESRGLSPDYSCRSGSCGTCKVKILKGAVAYKEPPLAPVGSDEALICSAFPAEEGNEDASGLQLAL